jgi:hypothetical protein
VNSGTATGADRTPGQPLRRVLEDESGQRLRRLRFVGRSVALLALCWLALIVLGGLGVGPAKHLPFGSELRLSVAPPPLRELPAPHQPTPSDLAPALPAPQASPSAGQATSAPVPTPATPGRSGAAPRRTSPTTATARGKATAPGQATTRTVPTGAAAAPGRLKHAAATTSTTTPRPKTPPAQSKRKP